MFTVVVRGWVILWAVAFVLLGPVVLPLLLAWLASSILMVLGGIALLLVGTFVWIAISLLLEDRPS